jgi:uncharacterized integral membrane protein
VRDIDGMSFADRTPTATDDDVVRDVRTESRREHAGRMGHRLGLYVTLLVLALLVLAIVLLALDNRQEARIGWVVGDADAAVVWIVLASAAVGWLAGIVTSTLVRRRTRADR